MKKLMIVTVAGLIGGVGGFASADVDPEHKRVVIKSRQIRLAPPPPQRPIALTGPSAATIDSKGYKIQSRGRSGFKRVRVGAPAP